MCVMDFAFDFQPLNASLESNVFKNKMNQQLVSSNNTRANSNQLKAGMQPNNFIGNNELDQLTNDIINLMNNIKVVSKKAEIVTKIK